MRALLIFAFILVLTPAAGAQTVKMAPLSPATAKLVEDAAEAAHRMFPRMPTVRLTSVMAEICGGERVANMSMRYCTSNNTIYVDRDLAVDLPDDGRVTYMIAHLMGHAAQVRHGVADDALSAIRAEPAREGELRAMVTAQVECLAGMISASAGLSRRSALLRWFTEEPFTGAHWGRDPLRVGPRVSIGLAIRDEWFQRGLRAEDLGACAVGEMGVGKLERALR